MPPNPVSLDCSFCDRDSPYISSFLSFSFFFSDMLWKRFTVVWAFIQFLFGTSGGPIGGFVSMSVAVYYFLVVRSYYFSLVRSREEDMSQLPQSAV